MKFKDLKVGEFFNTKKARYIKTVELQEDIQDKAKYLKPRNAIDLSSWDAGHPAYFSDEDDVISLAVGFYC